MTTLRESATQALKILERLHGGCTDSDDGTVEAITVWCPEIIDALRAALAEDAMQKFTEVSQEIEAALGCDHCNQPLYAAIKCRVCGRETPIIEPEIKGDNKPVAWIHADPDKPRVKFLEWRENEPGYRGDWIKTPLYTTPQQKPLTEEEIERLLSKHERNYDMVKFARAIEAKHEITS